jgi:uncharacterized membrane protein YsdA (DUF1294 family)
VNSKSFNSSHAKGVALTVVASLVVVAGLLVLPVMALHRRDLDLRWAGAYALVLSAITYWTYARDKRRAQDGEWRVSETQLHLLELLGGWPGAWIAQRRLRHKCSKGSYQMVFWLIVLGYQFAAFDSFHDWQLSRAGLKWIEQTSRRVKPS